jgi:hypothetical protein
MHPTHPRRRPWPTVLLLVTAVALALLAVVLVAPPAGAHALGGVAPSNYRTRVLAVRPPVPGLSVEVVDAGTRLRLHNASGSAVVVLGYGSEPWLRVDPGRSLAWHDHRAHWEAEEPPAQVRRAPGSAQVVVPEWTVKLRTGERLVDVVGEVRWVPGPSPLPWLAGAALLAMAVVATGRTRRWSGALVAALGLVVALDLVQVAGAWAGVEAPLSGRLLPVGASVAGWALAVLAIRQLRRRRFESGLFQLLLAAGLLTVVGGLGDLGFLFRSQLASGLPDWMVRAAVTAKVGLGLGALVAAGQRLRVTVRDWNPTHHDPTDWYPPVDHPSDEHPPDRYPPVDDPAHARTPSATLPLRGPERPAAWLRAGQRPAGRRPGQGPPGRRPVPGADVTSTLATVLPWPGSRRPDTFDDDPDLPGGA